MLWRRLCGTVLVLITLMKTMILSSVVAYHGLSLRVSECGVPCISKQVIPEINVSSISSIKYIIVNIFLHY
jgi:hypothetical protein